MALLSGSLTGFSCGILLLWNRFYRENRPFFRSRDISDDEVSAMPQKTLVFLLVMGMILTTVACRAEEAGKETGDFLYFLLTDYCPNVQGRFPELAAKLRGVPFKKYKELPENLRRVLQNETKALIPLLHRASDLPMSAYPLSLWESEPDKWPPPYVAGAPCAADLFANDLLEIFRMLQWQSWGLFSEGKTKEAVTIWLDLFTMGQRLDYLYSTQFMVISFHIRSRIIETISIALSDSDAMDEPVLKEIHDYFSRVDASMFEPGKWMRQIIQGVLPQLRCQSAWYQKLPPTEREKFQAKVLMGWLKSVSSPEEVLSRKQLFREKMDFLLSPQIEDRLAALKAILDQAADVLDLDFRVQEALAALSKQVGPYSPYHREILFAFEDQAFDLTDDKRLLRYLKKNWPDFRTKVRENRESVKANRDLKQGKGMVTPAERAAYQLKQGKSAALGELEALAGKGDIPAMVFLGVAYQYGWGVSQIEGKALEYFLHASAKGCSFAQEQAAGLLLGQEPPATEKAMGWYRRAASVSERACTMMLLNLLEEDPEDKSGRALAVAQQSSSYGWKLPQFILGCRYALGDGVKKDSIEAMKWFFLCDGSFYGPEKGAPEFLEPLGRRLYEELLAKMPREDCLEARHRASRYVPQPPTELFPMDSLRIFTILDPRLPLHSPK
jgi:hypothetical protein